MDRKEAQNAVGKQVLIDEASQGQYIGELMEVVAEPRKPWRGLVKIQTVETFPIQHVNKDGNCVLKEPIYEDGTVKEFPSTKIKGSSERHTLSFEESVLAAVEKEINNYYEEIKQSKVIIQELQHYIDRSNPKEREDSQAANSNVNELDDQYVVYTVTEVNGDIMLHEPIQQQHLALEGCPFEFELHIDDQWIPGHYASNWDYETLTGNRHSLKIGQTLRLHKKQFDPYHILINELEKPALESLEKSLQSFGMTHEDSVQCHNSLLIQLLSTSTNQRFKGVNFVTYQRQNMTIVVQHHYERELKETENDITYDRFELTTASGKRSIVTYTNEFSKDH